jgi:hypothetical protein
MTSAYNKKGKNVTRVGNWVEELALKDMTGHDRYENWTDEPGKRHARGGGKPGSQFNGARITSHSDSQDSKSYKSIASTDDPKDNAEFKVQAKVGPRERKRLAMLEAQAKEEVDRPKEERPMVSSHPPAPVYMYIYIYICVCVCVCIYVCVYVCTLSHINICIPLPPTLI